MQACATQAQVAQWFAQALAFHKQGHLAQAQALYEKTLSAQPEHFDGLHMLGVFFCQSRQPQRGAELIARAIKIQPQVADAHSNLGMAWQMLNKLDTALASYDRAIALNPNLAQAHANRGHVLTSLHRFEDAVASADRAIRLDPGHAGAYFNRGAAQEALNQLDAALASYDHAIACKPDFADAYLSRGNLLRGRKQLEAAVGSFEQALAIDAGHLGAALNLGGTLKDLGQFSAALVCLDKALAIDPNYGPARWNKSLVHLMNGSLAQGWDLYESGLHTPTPARDTYPAEGPVWDGKPFDGRLLVVAEQGIGDQILFASMLPDLMARQEAITVSLSDKLLPVFRRAFPSIQFVSAQPYPVPGQYQAHVAIGSLGQYFRREFSDFPLQRKPYLEADPARVAQLRLRPLFAQRRTCGISWRSTGPNYSDEKSIPLALWGDVLTLPQWRFISLQYGDTTRELEALDPALRVHVQRAEDIDCHEDIDGVMALIAACDIVITCSNTTAHLAGAMGKETMLLVPCASGRFWYWWHLHEGRSIWYPSITSLCQSQQDDWKPVLAGVQLRLEMNAQTISNGHLNLQ